MTVRLRFRRLKSQCPAKMKEVYMTLEEKIKQLESSGKIEKIIIYNEVFKICYVERNTNIFQYFDDYLIILRDFLTFESNPQNHIKLSFTDSYLIVVKFTSNMNNLKVLEKMIFLEEEFKEIITDDATIAQLYQAFGQYYFNSNNDKKSIYYLQESLRLIERAERNDIIPGRYTNLGFLYESKGKFDKAEVLYLKGLEFAKQANYETSLKLAYAAIGRLNSARNNYQKALMYFEESLKLFKGKYPPMDKIAILVNIASVYARINENQKALQYFEQINLDYVKQNETDMYYSINFNTSVVLINLEKYDRAEQNIASVLEHATKVHNSKLIIGCLINLGRINNKTQNFEEALKLYDKASFHIQQEKDERQEQIIYQNLGILFMNMKNFDEAIIKFKKAEELAKKQKNENQIITILENLANCYQKKRDYKEAFLCLQQTLKLNKKYDEKLKRKEKELNQNPLINSGNIFHYAFKNTRTQISNEIARKIGCPIIGNSEKLTKAIQQSFLSAKSKNVSVLLRGESGTGKELFAKLIHYSSDRSKFPFIDINSASFTKSLAESTLFGHSKGSFTGASYEQRGLFLKANNGTLFLDEIAEMPADIQAKFLRVLESKSISPIGSNKDYKVDFRLISATHQPLEELIEKKLFRFDLFNRINTIEILIPPLRERKEDLPLLIDYYSKLIVEKLNHQKTKFTTSALEKLYNYDYPGNVRELINILEKIILFSDNNKIDSYDIIFRGEDKKTEFNKDINLNIEENEVFLIKKAIRKSDGIKTKAAKFLGISYYSLKRRIEKYGLGI